MNGSDVNMPKCTPPEEFSKGYLSNPTITLEQGNISNSPQLLLPNLDHDNRYLFHNEAKNAADVFYARIQKITEEFLCHLEKQIHPLQQATHEVFQNASAEEDEGLNKLKYLIMIHTSCSQITNLLVNSPI